MKPYYQECEMRELSKWFRAWCLVVFVIITALWYFGFLILSLNSKWGHEIYVSFCNEVANSNGVKWN